MARWGCRADPNHWDWSHLLPELERYLRRAEALYLGDAWLLYTHES